jgi:hypothetical protein
MKKALLFSLLAVLLTACAAPQPASCDGSNLRPVNKDRQQEATNVEG